ncbi:uncharacterized protein LOC130297725 [Hyla sarda]|uniref:uncharacterized protein LOC130297725 n=1 Tax=Hyla sarda TaxID=327740 RepID=UPI0024C2FC4E|nr:uncharacterized protein LOC130297725 [Hyla sarda]XP_056406495.1 uncharacterized protein LOC130297725 [Hyla sarda]XP_056406496.1 uncharacterized protein LOC130297725 [Hyla sarda]
MAWGQIIPLFLMTMLHVVCCNGLLNSTCSKETCQCGETVTVTCTLTHPLQEIILRHNGTPLLLHKLPTKEGRIEHEKHLLEWTEDKVKVTISKVMFSDRLNYTLFLEAKESKGYTLEQITIDVFGICEPEMMKNNKTNELECVAESEKAASIVWMDSQRKLYQETRTRQPEDLPNRFKLWSYLKLTEEIGDNICCSVSYRINYVYMEKQICNPNTSAIGNDDLPMSKNLTLSTVLILLAVALVAAAFGYLLRRRDRTINRARSLSEGPLMEQEPNATEATTETV